jgi:glycosyltransferase involved in cell wall biosynthesis/uncharacterized protein YbaR (Trm112 family)
MMTISAGRVAVVITTLNEEVHIERAVSSALPLGAVFVVDSGSTDRTRELARASGATVWEHAWEGYARQKNWAREQLPVSFDWVFHLDADEYLTGVLALEVRDAVTAGRHRGFYVPRRYVFFGKELRHAWWYPDFQLRLFERHSGKYEDREVHEHVLLEGEAGFLTNSLFHDSRKGIDDFVLRHLRYADLEAHEMWQQRQSSAVREQRAGNVLGGWPDRRRLLKVRVWYRLPGRAVIRFLWMYLVRRGYKDGPEGRIYCQLIASYESMIDAKLLERAREPVERVTVRTPDLRSLLACPKCLRELEWSADSCHCTAGHWYPVTDGVPVLLAPEDEDVEGQTVRPALRPGDEIAAGAERKRPRTVSRRGRRGPAAERRPVVEEIEHLIPGATILTAGGATPADTEYLATAGAQVITVNRSLGSARRVAGKAKQESLPVLAIVADVERLPLVDRSVDVTYMPDALDCLNDPMTGVLELGRVADRATVLSGFAPRKIRDRKGSGAMARPIAILRAMGFGTISTRRHGRVSPLRPGISTTLLSLPGLFALVRAISALGGSILGTRVTVRALRVNS